MNMPYSKGLLMKGRLQINTAYNALSYTGTNEGLARLLGTLLDVHASIIDDEPEAHQNDILICLPGEKGLQDKKDLITSLGHYVTNSELPFDEAVAADSLLETLETKLP